MLGLSKILIGAILTHATTAPHVLFLCTGNYYRSRMAEAVFNHEAEKAGLTWRAVSRGLRTNLLSKEERRRKISPLTAKALEDLNIARLRTAEGPRQVTLKDMTEATCIIAMSEKEHRPYIQSDFGNRFRIKYWRVEDQEETDPEQALKNITKNTKALVSQIKTKNCL